MRTILLLLLTANCFGQFPEPRNNVYEYGITKQQWVITNTNDVFCLFETDKLSDYVDVKIKVVHESILYPYAYIRTNCGNYAIKIHKINKRGFTVFRLYYRLKDVWVGIDSGIKTIEFKTDKNWHKIVINDNLNKLKNYNHGTVPN